VRKISAILLISFFAFSQYARQLSYLECKFSNTFKTDAVKCDCDIKAGLVNQDDSQIPPLKIHTHSHPEEFFAGAREINIESAFNCLNSNHDHWNQTDECEGNHTKPWQPPNA
jgi:hypothetical protein